VIFMCSAHRKYNNLITFVSLHSRLVPSTENLASFLPALPPTHFNQPSPEKADDNVVV